ncbi:SDR family oxidoreductase [Lacisediminihabitans sp. H27-G8]|uniref:SDR family oxidoreductase n=1 Tax=Lacisediminihabitans sp. H27-G8 TaxID=3111909 RepID=UPI0038FBF972
MRTILVTGGTAQLGRPTVSALQEAGHVVRVLSRSHSAGTLSGDLLTGRGLGRALSGVETVVHLASTGSAQDVAATTLLSAFARSAGVEHVVFMSIVGIDDIPLPYYRAKREAEGVIVASGIPHTVLRATQFHSFVESLFTAQRRILPVTLVPRFSFQAISVHDVAARLVELVAAGPAGRVPDIGGPQVLTGHELATRWKLAAGSRRPLVPLRISGRTVAAFAAGADLVPGPPFGQGTFEEHLAARYPLARSESSR